MGSSRLVGKPSTKRLTLPRGSTYRLETILTAESNRLQTIGKEYGVEHWSNKALAALQSLKVKIDLQCSKLSSSERHEAVEDAVYHVNPLDPVERVDALRAVAKTKYGTGHFDGWSRWRFWFERIAGWKSQSAVDELASSALPDGRFLISDFGMKGSVFHRLLQRKLEEGVAFHDTLQYRGSTKGDAIDLAKNAASCSLLEHAKSNKNMFS
ncbi:MAG: hypothetical protein ABJZ55_16130 [Fuerstiella sp.]